VAAEHPFPVVGVGASAGGLQALEALFRGLPAGSGLAFIVVTHLPRGRESSLPEIVARYTDMAVQAASDGTAIEPNHVYFGPTDHTLTVKDSRIRLLPRESGPQERPIDVFLSSLGRDLGDAAVGILLSGSGSDGVLGIKGIKEHGGLTIAQGRDGSGPQHAEMPDAAIAAGVIDLVLPVEDIGPRLARFAQNFGAPAAADETDDHAPAEERQGVHAIYQILIDQVGHDFSGYKQPTFQRRLRRRMNVLQIDTLDAYVERLHSDPQEVTALFRDLLISVTNFFRDAEAFEALEQLVLPSLFARKGADEAVRIWVPGCATGEEAYSLAILVREHMRTLRARPKIQLFATDIDGAALSVARAGRYPAALMESVPPARLNAFFSGDEASYVVNKEIRDMCVFSPHSVLRDPPFSRIDLISCRNLLIYLGSEFQSHVIPVFHFALRPNGYLFLGTSENVSQHQDLFTLVDKKHRIFQRRDHVVAPLQMPAMAHNNNRNPLGLHEIARRPAALAVNLRRAVEARVMERFAPAHVVVSRDGDILHYSPRTGKYLEPAVGLPNRQLLAMARKGLRLDLRSALHEAVETGRRIEREHIAVELGDRTQLIDLTIDPLAEKDAEPLFLVIFKDVGPPLAASQAVRQQSAQEGDERVDQLEQELRDTRERLQGTIEEYESALEELKASNEELQSVNEELQSTNEELETSKEELQSVNEELHTVNAELNGKIEELDRAHSDLRNIFESTRIATVFLDRNLRIRTFTPDVAKIFNLISTDRGRPLTDIVSQIDHGDLAGDVRTVFERGEPIERNVRCLDGRAQYLMRILPYHSDTKTVDGVLVTFVDVTKIVEKDDHQRTPVEKVPRS
jgi:two-component system, chemotaxis family, CheB/CheR fusion protein